MDIFRPEDVIRPEGALHVEIIPDFDAAGNPNKDALGEERFTTGFRKEIRCLNCGETLEYSSSSVVPTKFTALFERWSFREGRCVICGSAEIVEDLQFVSP